MRVERTYEGKISLKVIDIGDNNPKTQVSIEFEDTNTMGQDAFRLIPALYDLLKAQHEKYSMINFFRKN